MGVHKKNFGPCSNCGSETTYIDKDGYTKWLSYNGKVVCNRCYDMKNSPEKNRKFGKIYRARKMSFTPTAKLIMLKEPPRKGICQLCGAVKGVNCKQTNIHHFAEYHESDPLKDTIELCVSCHSKQHRDPVTRRFVSRKVL